MRRDGVPVTPRLEVRCRCGGLDSNGFQTVLKSTCRALRIPLSVVRTGCARIQAQMTRIAGRLLSSVGISICQTLPAHLHAG